MSFDDEVTQAGSEMGGGNDFYKFKEGDNKLRILTEPKIQVSRYGYGICYEGAQYCSAEALNETYAKAQKDAEAAGKDPAKVSRPTLTKKWMAWAVDRSTGGLVLVTLPYGVSKTLKEIKASEESGFEGWPMPFDINIKAKNAGKKEVEYELIPSRKDTPVTQDELDELAKKSPVEQILERMKEKARAKAEGTSGTIQTQDDEDSGLDAIKEEDIPW